MFFFKKLTCIIIRKPFCINFREKKIFYLGSKNWTGQDRHAEGQYIMEYGEWSNSAPPKRIKMGKFSSSFSREI